jgi:2-dehydro-3-deoxyphosphogluconate aldolase / (4S)-4-hydroxy-2-oxoglutarate aldolase
MALTFPDSLRAKLHHAGVLAVLVIEDALYAVPVARALLAGGVQGLELTLRTPAALEAVKLIRAEVPEMMVGVGTILTPGQVGQALEAGAAFGVAPGMNPRVVREARQVGLPFAPGVCTPTDIEMALEEECLLLKLFPAEPSGGLAYLKTIAAPFAHLGVGFIPLGGLGPSNAESYLREPSVVALGGSWLASRQIINQKKWDVITENAREAMNMVERARS